MIIEKIHRKIVKGLQHSFSQEVEELVLARIFEGHKPVFYVDVGAHHPTRFSNTSFFYRRGWSGINIDAMPGSMKAFKSLRSRDVNLEIPVCEKETMLKYYMFNEPALNSFDRSLSLSRQNETYKIIKTQNHNHLR